MGPVAVDLSRFVGPRIEDYRLHLLDVNDTFVRVLDGVTAMKYTANLDAMIQRGFSADLDYVTDISWQQARFQPWVTVNGHKWPLGVFIPASPTLYYEDDRTSASVSFLDKTAVLDQNKIEETYGVDAGSVVTDVVTALIMSTGETAVAITTSTKTVRIPQVWPPNTSILKIINDLLSSIDYASLWSDGWGQYRAQPNINLAYAEPTLSLEYGVTALFARKYRRQQDVAGIPNKVILVSQASGETPALVATATNTDPNSPYSYPARGNRWITRTYDNVHAADQSTLNSLAQQYLWTASTPPAYLELQHAVIPVRVGEITQFVSPALTGRYVVNELTLDLNVGAQIAAKWKEIA